jgi:hypothetical protein
MKLYVNIILIAFSIIPCWATRTETQTVEDDGTVKTIITDEWTEERTFGRGHGRGDNIVIMTNDNDNGEDQTSEGTSNGQDSCNISSKTVPVTRFFNGKSYTYSIDKQKETTLANSGYKKDGPMGRIVAQRSDFPDCHDLVPITQVTHSREGYNMLLANTGRVYSFEISTWPETAVIGYGVLEKGKCGATVPARQINKANTEFLHITDAEGEFDAYKSMGYEPQVDGAQYFYVWGENVHFCPLSRPIEKKTALLNRLYNTKLSDFEFTTNPKVEEILTKPGSGFRFDGTLGRVVINPSDLPESKDLVPITKLFRSSSTDHVLLVDQATTDAWVKAGWTNAGVIGYGVLEKDKCGATREVRHAFMDIPYYKAMLRYQTTILSQYEPLVNNNFVDGGTKKFYIWEA